MDNPLIVHIARVEQINELVSEFPEKARILAEKFWPGPLTITFKYEPLHLKSSNT